jgi:uncharacterized membrane protein
MQILAPKGFLQVGGAVLVLVGILGFIGVLGPTADRSIFGAYWYFDNAENWAHLVLGIVGLIAALMLAANYQKMLVAVLGVIGVLIGLYSLFGPIPEGLGLLSAQLENPLDTILHLVVGCWALVAAFKKWSAPTN